MHCESTAETSPRSLRMAAVSSEEEKAYFPGRVEGTKSLPVNFSCYQLLKPTFDKANEYCSLDVLPILMEEAAFPARENCSFNSSHGKDAYIISGLPEEGNVSPQSTLPLNILNFLRLPLSFKNQMTMDNQLSSKNCSDSQMESGDNFSPSAVNVNIEKENSGVLKADEELGMTKCEGAVPHFQKVLQRQASLNTTDKSPTERIHDVPANNRWRKYKRAASFDSRKVVFLFSILSSMGTLILIFLTLRVKLTGDGLNHV